MDIDWPASGLGVTLALFSINSVISKSQDLCITLLGYEILMAAAKLAVRLQHWDAVKLDK